ncbi:MAG: Nif3-like dinuclear metal center hexameric protein [Paludibacter sp.]|nr:Nif3-like dinuclear metal center hexameric protein [Paludibacter sp.]
MIVKTLINLIENFAPLSLQESYDNSGLLVGDPDMEVAGVLITIDITEAVIEEAIIKKCNLIISHHPLIFNGLKRLVGQNEVQRCVKMAVKNDIAIYAAHTNVDNVLHGVNGRIADKMGLKNRKVLQPKQNTLLKLITFVPKIHAFGVREALFEAGAGHIGNYDSCSFNVEGTGTFRGNDHSKPFVGELNQFHSEPEIRIEMIFPDYLKTQVINTLLKKHPYEEPAFDIIPLQNEWSKAGAGLIGELSDEEEELTFLHRIKSLFGCSVIRHSNLLGEKIKTVALCGGSGSGLLNDAIRLNADIFISADFKYHEFFDAGNRILIADVGHYESEQFTKDIFYEIITKKMPTFAVQISEIKTNPINYL